MSQQVATLEREVGMPLLERTRQGPRLTQAGEVLVFHAEAALARLAEAERELAAIAGLEGGELHVASFPSASATLLTRAVSLFVERHPRVRLSVSEAEPEESLPRLRAADLDLALAFDYRSRPAAAAEDRDLEWTLLLTESMHVVLPVDHELAGRERVDLNDLSDEAWLCGVCESSCGQAVKDVCREAGFEPRVAFESDDHHVLQGFVAAGLGVTLLPDLALPTLRSDVVVRPTAQPAPQRRVWAVTRTDPGRAPATGAMLKALQEVGEEFAREVVPLQAVA